MEVLNYRRLDAASRRCAYHNPNTDPDLRRLLRSVDRQLAEAEGEAGDTADGGGEGNGAGDNNNSKSRSQSTSRSPTKSRFPIKVTFKPSRRSRDEDTQPIAIDLLLMNQAQHPRPRGRNLVRDKSRLANLMKDATLPPHPVPDALDRAVLHNLNQENMGGLMLQARTNPKALRRLVLDVPDTQGKKLRRLPLLHLLVLHHSFHGDPTGLLPRVLPPLYSASWLQGIIVESRAAPVDSLAEWELRPGVVGRYSALHLAAYYGDTEMVRALVRVQADVNLQTLEGDTPARLAAMAPEHVRHEIFEHLMDNDGDVTIANKDGVTPLHSALTEGATRDTLELLVTRGRADVNATKRRGLQTPLIQAVAFQNSGAIELLLGHGADVGHATPSRQTALHYAVAAHSRPMVRKLLAHVGWRGSHALHDTPDLRGTTPLMLAVTEGLVDVVQTVVTACHADLDLADSLGRTVWHMALEGDTSGATSVLEILIDMHKSRACHQGSRNPSVSAHPPLHVATSMDRADLVGALLEKGLSALETDTKEMNTFYHEAAGGDRRAVLGGEYPCGQRDLLTAVNRSFDTPLHVAARSGGPETVGLLLEAGFRHQPVGFLREKNVSGSTPLHLALQRPTPEVALVILHRMSTLEAGAPGGAVTDVTDVLGNTYLHLAARRGFVPVIRLLLELNAEVNQRNERGNTPLHEAVLSGHAQAAAAILKLGDDGLPSAITHKHQRVADLHLKNGCGQTVLHCAVRSTRATADLLRMLVKVIQYEDPVGALLNDADAEGNTALHLVARRRGPKVGELMRSLTACNFSVVNHDLDTPYHVAARQRDPAGLEALLGVAEEAGAALYLDRDNTEGRSVLMVCVEAGHLGLVGRLVEAGADLSHRSRATGDTLLHHLVRLSAHRPADIALWRDAYRAICDTAVDWWCACNEWEKPDRRSALYQDFKSIAVKLLTSCVPNDPAGAPLPVYCSPDPGQGSAPVEPLAVLEGSGSTVMQLTISLGAAPMLDTILNTHGVYCRPGYDGKVRVRRYDVTYLTPDTDKTEDDHRPHQVLSCLEALSYIEDYNKVIEFLDITPIRQLSRSHWARYQWLFMLLMLLHVLYMGLFSYFSLRLQAAMPGNASRPTVAPPGGGACNVTEGISAPSPLSYCWLLSWPLVLLVYLTMHISFRAQRWDEARRTSAVRERRRERSRVKAYMSRAYSALSRLHYLHREFQYAMGVVFSLFVILWFAYYSLGRREQVYFLVLAIGVGWLFTLVFTAGFATVNAFSIMLKYIIIHDILRFLLVFAFIFLGFALALHATFLQAPTFAEEFPTVWHTFFYVFRMMLAVDDPFSETFDLELARAGISTSLPKIIYVVFMIITAIVLLNLLIAMMSRTYSRVTAREATHWRVANMRLAIGLEKQLRRTKHLLRFPVATSFVVRKERKEVHACTRLGAVCVLATTRHYATFPAVPVVGQDGEDPVGDSYPRVVEERLAAVLERMERIEVTLQAMAGSPGRQQPRAHKPLGQCPSLDSVDYFSRADEDLQSLLLQQSTQPPLV